MTPDRRAEIEAILQIWHTRDDCDTRFEWRLLQALRDSVAEIDRLNKVVDQAIAFNTMGVNGTYLYNLHRRAYAAYYDVLSAELERRSKA